MSIDNTTRSDIRRILIKVIREKIDKYNPETDHKPFHYRLLGRDRYATFSFIHSMNTTFGISVWEQIAVILSKGAGYHAERQYKLLGEIDSNTEVLVEKLHTELRTTVATVNKADEINQIRNIIQTGLPRKDPDSIVDLYIRRDNYEDYIDITSVKPNIKEFAVLKRKLLRWTALRLSQDRTADVITRLALPYNPYYPNTYDRWTLKGLYDLDFGEILIAEDFWNYTADCDVYEDLLDIFQQVGDEIRPELDRKFAEFK